MRMKTFFALRRHVVLPEVGTGTEKKKFRGKFGLRLCGRCLVSAVACVGQDMQRIGRYLCVAGKPHAKKSTSLSHWVPPRRAPTSCISYTPDGMQLGLHQRMFPPVITASAFPAQRHLNVRGERGGNVLVGSHIRPSLITECENGSIPPWWNHS